jgi:alkylation response protein AidB-like acyl-CoA dehydrogenase
VRLTAQRPGKEVPLATTDTLPLDRLLDAVRALAPLIRAHADEAEQQRRLPQPVVTALADAGLFRLYTPHTLGGWEVEPLTFYRVVEALACIDASTAWCVWLASGNPVYVGRSLPDPGAAAVFGRDPQVVTAGVVAPYGRAVVHDGGYVVSGRWPYASGCQHSTWLFCCCTVYDGEQLRLTAPGDPEVRVLCVPTSHVTILDTWEVSGLAGTGSHDVVIEEVFVPEAYSGLFGAGPLPHSTHFQGLLYRYPFILASALPIGALALGIAQGAVETVLELAQTKQPARTTTLLREQALFHVRLAEAVALVRKPRHRIHYTSAKLS